MYQLIPKFLLLLEWLQQMLFFMFSIPMFRVFENLFTFMPLLTVIYLHHILPMYRTTAVHTPMLSTFFLLPWTLSQILSWLILHFNDLFRIKVFRINLLFTSVSFLFFRSGNFPMIWLAINLMSLASKSIYFIVWILWTWTSWYRFIS